MYANGFRFYFTPLSGVLFTFPSRYWSTIGRQRVFSLGGWSPHIQTGYHVSRPTHRHPTKTPFRVRGFHPLWLNFPKHSAKAFWFLVNWAVPGSLAATDGISVDFSSSGYLDVSVPRVRLRALCIQTRMTCLHRPGFPIRTPPDQSLFASSPRTIAGYDVLHRLLPPRHPPFALTRLTI